MEPRAVLQTLLDEFKKGEAKTTECYPGCKLHSASLEGGCITFKAHDSPAEPGVLTIYSPYLGEVISITSNGRENRQGIQVSSFPRGVSADDPVFPAVAKMLSRLSELVPIKLRR